MKRRINKLLLFGFDTTRLVEFESETRALFVDGEFQAHRVHSSKEAIDYVKGFEVHVVFVDAVDGPSELPGFIWEIKHWSPRTEIVVQALSRDVDSGELSRSRFLDVVEFLRLGVLDVFDEEVSVRSAARTLEQSLRFASFTVDRSSLRERWLLSLFQRVETSRLQVASGGLASVKKGKVLEEFCAALFRTVEAWRVTPNVSKETEEVDLLIHNISESSFWKRFGDIILVECKNTKNGVGMPEFREFFYKVANRGETCRLGFLVARSFKRTIKTEVGKLRGDRVTVVPLDLSYSLPLLLYASDRGKQLQDFVERLEEGKDSWDHPEKYPRPPRVD